ncbi:MAG: hypothetical protein AB7U82_12395 [Blastocatellales bacterium]
MWKNISELLSLIFTFSEKFKHHDKRIEDAERQINELTRQVAQLTVDLAQLVERDKARELLFRQALEIEKLKLENEKLKTERALPPAKDNQS